MAFIIFGAVSVILITILLAIIYSDNNNSKGK